eukprot:9069179-Alexandrium_andersonii.AAC.1
MSASLVGSEMCIRDRPRGPERPGRCEGRRVARAGPPGKAGLGAPLCPDRGPGGLARSRRDRNARAVPGLPLVLQP